MHNILIVDDEPLARERIRNLLAKRDDCKVVGEAANGEEAARAILEGNPEIVFLDIEMPAVNGFDLIRLIGPAKMPAVIFVTAYDQYAIKAFDVAAADYILKPFDQERFYQALERAVQSIKSSNATANKDRLNQTLAETAERQSAIQRILVKSTGTVSIVDVNQIEWIEAQGNYLLLHQKEENHLHRETIKALAESLDSTKFVRIHRSTIVNLDYVRRVDSHTGGDRTVLMKDGTELRLSRRYRDNFERLFK